MVGSLDTCSLGKKQKKKSAAVGHQWGKYGIINETECVIAKLMFRSALMHNASMYNKEPEFRAWLVEERIINPETISKDQTRKEFAKFVEDYNTGAYHTWPPRRLLYVVC